jgi:hypothetical protein
MCFYHLLAATQVLRATPPPVYTKFWMKKSQKHVDGFVQQNGFGPAFLHMRMRRLAKGMAKPNTCCC